MMMMLLLPLIPEHRDESGERMLSVAYSGALTFLFIIIMIKSCKSQTERAGEDASRGFITQSRQANNAEHTSLCGECVVCRCSQAKN